jgi:hypothetical protein
VNELFPIFCSNKAYYILNSVRNDLQGKTGHFFTDVESTVLKVSVTLFLWCIAGWVVGSLEILGSPASLVRSIGNGISDFFRLPYEGLTRGPGAFVSGVSRGTTSFVKHISKGSSLW